MASKKVKGFKAFNKDLTCRGFQYEIGKEYEYKGKVEICSKGFHFCESLADCYNFYGMNEDTRICKVEAWGTVLTDDDGIKYVTDHIRIVKEVKNPREKSNLSKSSSGYCNSGDRNSGNWNSGDRNSGDWNSGDWNSGDWNSGVFNTDKEPKIKIFDKESDWTMAVWRNSDACWILRDCPYSYSDFVYTSDMTDEEKESHPEHKTIGGYIKVFKVTAEDKQKWWDNLSDNQKDTIKALPNFDEKKFCECIGIYHI